MKPTAPNNEQNSNLGSAQANNTASSLNTANSSIKSASNSYDKPIQTPNPPNQNAQTTPLESSFNTNQQFQQTGLGAQQTVSTTQEPVINTNPAPPVQPQPPHQAIVEPPKRSKKPLIFLVFLFLFVLILASLGSLTYAVAYEKIKLNKYPEIQKKVSYFVMNLSFMPKTPKYLLAQSALAHQNVTKQSFDISAAIDSADLTSSLGLSSLDIQIKGNVDYSDPTNVFGNLELSFTKDFNIELKKKNEMLYFRLNKLPSYLFAFMGIGSSSFNPLLEKWVSYDTTPLETEARKTIQEDKEVDPLSEEFIDENFQKYLDDQIFSKMQMSTDTEESHAVYKISLDADSELIDYIGKKIEDSYRQNSNYAYPQSNTDDLAKLSDFVKNLKWEMYIDQETYYTRKAILSIDLKYDSSDGLGAFSMGRMMNPLPSNNSAKIALAIKFDKFGEDVVVDAPTESITFEEFTELVTLAINDMYGGILDPVGAMRDTKDAKRKADLANIQSRLELYYADNSQYPYSLTDLNDIYFSEIPTDPDKGSYYYEVSTDLNSYELCANLEVPTETETTCPNPSYNYHISSINQP